jgi:hypothetical protein
LNQDRRSVSTEEGLPAETPNSNHNQKGITTKTVVRSQQKGISTTKTVTGLQQKGITTKAAVARLRKHSFQPRPPCRRWIQIKTVFEARPPPDCYKLKNQQKGITTKIPTRKSFEPRPSQDRCQIITTIEHMHHLEPP